jgi:hypothetical protein
LRSIDPNTIERDIVTVSDFYLDKASLRWVRFTQVRGVAPAASTSSKNAYTRTDFHYSRFNSPVNIKLPRGLIWLSAVTANPIHAINQ